MSIAAATREAVRERPFLLEALGAGVVNYRAAAATLDVGDVDAVATALRRYAEDLPDRTTASRDARVTMHRGVGLVEDPTEALLTVGGSGYAPDAGPSTALVANGDVDARALETVLSRLHAADVAVEATAVADDGLVVVVGRRAGAEALRVVESALDAVAE